jgi:hypothetical protein
VELEMAEVFNDTSRIWLQSESIEYEEFLKEVPHHPNNKTVFIEIPIIASVVNHTQLFSAIKIGEDKNYNSSLPLPLYMADRTLAMPDNRFNQTFAGFVIQPDLLISNNFKKQIMIHYARTKASSQEIYTFTYTTNNQIVKLPYIPQSENDESIGWYRIVSHDPKIDFFANLERFLMSSGTVVSYKEQYIELYKAPYFNGNKMVWLKIDDVMVPQHVQIFDRNLFCKYINTGQQRQGVTSVKGEQKDVVVYLYTGTDDNSSRTAFFETGYFES